jgi:hypothetical protein
LFTISLFLIFIVLTPTANARLTTISPPIQDSYIVDGQPLKNYGSLEDINVYFSSSVGWSRSLVQFDLSGVPEGVIINSATLALQIKGFSGSMTKECSIYQVTSEWNESDVTSQLRNATQTWSTYGGDYKLEDGVSTLFPLAQIYHYVDVTEIVKNWIEDGEPNYGFLIKAVDESLPTWFLSFWTKDAGLVKGQPILTIDWDRKPARTQRGSVQGVYSYVIKGGVVDSTPTLQIQIKNLKKTTPIVVEINYHIQGSAETPWMGSPITLLKKTTWKERTDGGSNPFSVGDLVDVELNIDGTYTVHETVLISSQTLH